MNTNNRRLGIHLPALIIAIVITVALRTVACFTGLDYTYGFYTNGILSTAMAVTVTAACIFLLSYTVFGNPGNIKASFSTPATYIPSGLVGVTLLFLAGELFSRWSKGNSSPATAGVSAESVLTLLCAITALFSIGHFFLNTFFTEASNATRGAFSLATVVFMCLYSALLYFDTSKPINAPNKIIDQMAFLFCALFFLYEARISLGREKWRGYITFGLIGALLTAYSSIPALILYIVKGEIISASVAENAVCFALMLFIISRLALIPTLPEQKPSLAIANMDAYATERASRVKEINEKFGGTFGSQLSIDDLFDVAPDEAGDEESGESGEKISIPDSEETEKRSESITEDGGDEE